MYIFGPFRKILSNCSNLMFLAVSHMLLIILLSLLSFLLVNSFFQAYLLVIGSLSCVFLAIIS